MPRFEKEVRLGRENNVTICFYPKFHGSNSRNLNIFKKWAAAELVLEAIATKPP